MDLIDFKLVGSSKPDTMYYQKIMFTECGQSIYALNSNSIKVYNMDRNSVCLDSV